MCESLELADQHNQCNAEIAKDSWKCPPKLRMEKKAQKFKNNQQAYIIKQRMKIKRNLKTKSWMRILKKIFFLRKTLVLAILKTKKILALNTIYWMRIRATMTSLEELQKTQIRIKATMKLLRRFPKKLKNQSLNKVVKSLSKHMNRWKTHLRQSIGKSNPRQIVPFHLIYPMKKKMMRIPMINHLMMKREKTNSRKK